jgi:transcriptional regulator with XRE-family HTH domain
VTEIETMGKRIGLLREARGLTQAQLAEVCGVTRAAAHSWENDATPNIRPPNLLMLAKVLGTDPYYLVFGPKREPKGGFPIFVGGKSDLPESDK